MEVCIDSVESGINAEKGGASRVELACNLVEGGTTPSAGLLSTVKKRIHIPVFVMIRPRGGDFVYSPDELEVMKEDLKVLKANGADGFVFGILTPEGDVDETKCHEFNQLAAPLPTTFHRAFDMTRDPFQALETVISLGFTRVLTSGHDSTALEGLPCIRELVTRACGRIIVVPGGGITERNLGRILEESRAKEFHGSARSTCDSAMIFRNTCVTMGGSFGPPEFTTRVSDHQKISSLVAIAKAVSDSSA